MSYVKSPFTYSNNGILPSIVSALPKDIATFVDLFGGNGDVFANVTAGKYIYNEITPQVSEFISWLRYNTPEQSAEQVDSYIIKYKLSDDNEQGYEELREAYNRSNVKYPAHFFALVVHAAYHQINFDDDMDFTTPFGHTTFDADTYDQFLCYAQRVRALDLAVVCDDFYEIPISWDSFVFCDPPKVERFSLYGRNPWTAEDEERLLYYLDFLNGNGIKFGLLSELDNDNLREWAADFNVHQLENGKSLIANY